MARVNTLMARTFSSVYLPSSVSVRAKDILRLKANGFGAQRYYSEVTGNQSRFLLVFIKEPMTYLVGFYRNILSCNLEIQTGASVHSSTNLHAQHIFKQHIHIHQSSWLCPL